MTDSWPSRQASQLGDRATLPAPPPQTVPSDADGGLFGDWRDQALAENLGIIIAETRKAMRRERDKALAERDARISRLEAKVEVLLGLLAGDITGNRVSDERRSHDHVVELPKNFLRRVHNG
jgi:hypothetical protein